MAARRLSLLGAAAALIVVAAPALAQTTLDDPLDARDARRVDRMEKVMRELRAIVFQLRDTGKPVIVQPADTEARIQDQVHKIGDLEQSLTRLNGSLETTTHDLDQTKRANVELQAQVKALSDRLTAIEQAAAPPTAPSADANTPPAPRGDPTAAFSKARQLMLGGDYDAAEAAFSDYVKTYPDAPRAPEARYWWGKTLSVRGDQAAAAGAYIGAIRGWPQTAWAPDAVVELARSLVALKKPSDACQTLAELGRRYPKATPAVTARAAATRAQAKCG